MMLADASPVTPGEDALSRRHPSPSSQRRLVRYQALLLKAALPSLLAKGLQNCSEGLITDWKLSDQKKEKNTLSRTGNFGLIPLQYMCDNLSAVLLLSRTHCRGTCPCTTSC
jgi:hypothetical protein